MSGDSVLAEPTSAWILLTRLHVLSIFRAAAAKLPSLPKEEQVVVGVQFVISILIGRELFGGKFKLPFVAFHIGPFP
jgi:hypothetical protein